MRRPRTCIAARQPPQNHEPAAPRFGISPQFTRKTGALPAPGPSPSFRRRTARPPAPIAARPGMVARGTKPRARPSCLCRPTHGRGLCKALPSPRRALASCPRQPPPAPPAPRRVALQLAARCPDARSGRARRASRRVSPLRINRIARLIEPRLSPRAGPAGWAWPCISAANGHARPPYRARSSRSCVSKPYACRNRIPGQSLLSSPAVCEIAPRPRCRATDGTDSDRTMFAPGRGLPFPPVAHRASASPVQSTPPSRESVTLFCLLFRLDQRPRPVAGRAQLATDSGLTKAAFCCPQLKPEDTLHFRLHRDGAQSIPSRESSADCASPFRSSLRSRRQAILNSWKASCSRNNHTNAYTRCLPKHYCELLRARLHCRQASSHRRRHLRARNPPAASREQCTVSRLLLHLTPALQTVPTAPTAPAAPTLPALHIGPNTFGALPGQT